MVETSTIESYLARMGVPYRASDESTWILDDEGDEFPPVVIALRDPLLVFECRVLKAPEGGDGTWARTLLELNATDMTAGAYGLDQGWIVVTDALQAENLDYNEFQGAVDGIAMALNAHLSKLRALA